MPAIIQKSAESGEPRKRGFMALRRDEYKEKATLESMA